LVKEKLANYGALLLRGRLCALERIFACWVPLVFALAAFNPLQTFAPVIYGTVDYFGDPSTVRPWCNTDRPLLYSFVQDFYWYDRTLARFQSLQEPKIRFFGLGMLDFCVTGL
jgi:hypothetical protein